MMTVCMTLEVGDGWWFWLMNSEIAAYKYRRSLKLAVSYQTQIHSFQLKNYVHVYRIFHLYQGARQVGAQYC